MEIFGCKPGWKSPTKMVSSMDAMFFLILNLRIAITGIVLKGHLRGTP